jgi:hypothetical protein
MTNKSSDLLTFLEHPGAQAIVPETASTEDRLALSLHLQALRKQGHAVQADELPGCPGELRIWHYKSCTHPACVAQKKEVKR